MRKDDLLAQLIERGYNVAQFIGIDSQNIYSPRIVDFSAFVSCLEE